MFEQFMWQKFLKSGNIYDYLVLKEEINFSDYDRINSCLTKYEKR